VAPSKAPPQALTGAVDEFPNEVAMEAGVEKGTFFFAAWEGGRVPQCAVGRGRESPSPEPEPVAACGVFSHTSSRAS
jgi:hypothetical protein